MNGVKKITKYKTIFTAYLARMEFDSVVTLYSLRPIDEDIFKQFIFYYGTYCAILCQFNINPNILFHKYLIAEGIMLEFETKNIDYTKHDIKVLMEI